MHNSVSPGRTTSARDESITNYNAKGSHRVLCSFMIRSSDQMQQAIRVHDTLKKNMSVRIPAY
jgi:hypothetical protein